jgi:hypothetical protein
MSYRKPLEVLGDLANDRAHELSEQEYEGAYAFMRLDALSEQAVSVPDRLLARPGISPAAAIVAASMIAKGPMTVDDIGARFRRHWFDMRDGCDVSQALEECRKARLVRVHSDGRYEVTR